MQSEQQPVAANPPHPIFAETKAMLADMAAELDEFQRAAGGSVTDFAANWLASQYLLAVRAQAAALPPGPERFKLLQRAVGDVVALQRGGHSAARLQLDREKLELEQQKHRDALAAAKKEIQERRDPKLPMSDEDRRAIVAKVDEIMGLA
jgi:hypothetical protein